MSNLERMEGLSNISIMVTKAELRRHPRDIILFLSFRIIDAMQTIWKH
jgi:hypothetical protein